jgi:general secretion pathway protein D
MQTVRRRLPAFCLIALLATGSIPARTRKGDALIVKSRAAELKDTTKDLEEALRLAEEALETDRSDTGYQLDVARLRAFAAQYHVYEGQVLRDKGKIEEAQIEFEKAKALDPASVLALQELERTRQLTQELRVNPGASVRDLLMRPLPLKNRRDEETYVQAAPVPQLTVEITKPLPVFKVNNQTAAEVFQAICREAGLRVLFDPEYQSRSLGLNTSLDFRGATLAETLDYLALITKSFWKPLSGDTIFVTNDDPARRSAYEEQVTKAFYLTNAPVAQEVNDIANTVRSVTDIKKLLVHSAQNVIVARADADRVALAEKIVADLDKPKAEIIIDVIILSVNKNWARTLGVQLLGLTGSNILFNPRPELAPALVGGRIGVPLDTLKRLESGDYNVTLPGAALNALLETRGTKVLDKAQLRTIEGQKSVLKIGQKVPYATGSFSGGFTGGTGALVNTQFQFFDVGLNIDVIAKVHEPDEVSLHIESDTSAVQDRIDLGGVLQPIISQRRRTADVRVKEGEINFWDIVTQRQDVRTTTGVPGLSGIPILGRVFTNEKLERAEQQVLTLLVPHIIRAPDIRDVNLMGLPSGSDQVVRLRYATPEARRVAAQATNQVVELRPTETGAPGGGSPMAAGAGIPTPAPPMGAAGSGMAMAGPAMGDSAVPSALATAAPAMGNLAMGGPAASASAPTAVSRLFFESALTTLMAGQTFRTELKLAGPGEASSGTLTVEYDPAQLKPVSVTAGRGVKEARPRRDGRLTFSIGAAEANQVLAALQFRAVSAGVSRLNLSAVRLSNAAGAPIVVQAEPLAVPVTTGN